MDIEILESKIAELLNISEDEKTFALAYLKNKLVNYLNVNEAIKIKNLGVFQLKEKLSDINEVTLLFSPDEDVTTNEALFINLEIDSTKKNNSEFSEEVFQLGINKRFIPVGGASENNEESKQELHFEKQIDELIETSEKLENFDLWDDYLKAKDSTSILNDENEEEKKIDSFFDDNITLDDDPLYHREFVELNEDEILDDLIDENNLLDDDILIDKKENDGIVNSKNELNDVKEIAGIIDDKIEQEVENNIIENDSIESKILDEVEIEGNEANTKIEETNNILHVSLPEGKEVNSKNELSDVSQTNSNKTTTANTLGDLSSDKNDLKEISVRNKIGKRRRSPIIYSLIAGFIIVGAIGIYYIFFQNPTWLYDKYEIETILSEQHAKEFVEDNNKIELESNELITEENTDKNPLDNEINAKADNSEKVESQSISKTEQEIKKAETTNIRETNDQPNQSIGKTTKKSESAKLLSAPSSESEASKNIFFDGKNYSIQISSWKQNTIAKKEAQKLIARGFPAHVVKKYIAKLNSTWHRVRVGPYATIGEAKSVQRKIK